MANKPKPVAKPAKYIPPKKYPAAIGSANSLNGLEGGTKFYDRMGRQLTAAGGVAPKGVTARFNLYNEALKGGAPVGTKFAPGALKGLRDERKATGGKEAARTAAGSKYANRVNGLTGRGTSPGPTPGPPPVAASAVAPATADALAGTGAYAEGDTAITDYAGMRGKAYKGAGSTAAGQTGKPKVKPVELTGKQKKNLKNRGKRQKSGTKAGYHISKTGEVVANRGKKGGK
jgi:hypothetical protein